MDSGWVGVGLFTAGYGMLPQDAVGYLYRNHTGK